MYESFDQAPSVARGTELLELAKERWPDDYGSAPHEQLLLDAVNAVLGPVPRAEIVERLGHVLGALAADMLVIHALAARGIAEDHEVHDLMRALSARIHERHWGDPEDW